MAYDASRDRVVRFGGTQCDNSAGDTWEWDGVQWEQMFPPASPPPRHSTTMVYDPQRQRVVMFGGFFNSTPFSTEFRDLWEWDGTTWTERQSPVRPPARSGHMLAYDEARRCVVLFGGGNSPALDDTWLWDGTSWQQAQPATKPQPRAAAGMAYDRARQRVVMFGGLIQTTTSFMWSDETWEWDGSDWHLAQPSVRPLTRVNVKLAYDDLRQRIIAFGGAQVVPIPPLRTDTWAWDGQEWTHLATSGPPGRAGHGMVYDSLRQRVLIHGGGYLGPVCFADVWSLDPYLIGTGTFGSGGIQPVLMTTGGNPQVGNQSFGLSISAALGGSVSGLLFGPEQSFPFAGGTVFVNPILAFALPLGGVVGTPGAGTAAFPIPVPNDPTLIGGAVSCQAIVVDAGGTVGFALTNALRVVIS